MMRVTTDGKRMHISNSLLATVDQATQFWVRAGLRTMCQASCPNWR